jgi:RNA polymerase sigma-70 factor (ECF subfamily)
MASWTEVMDTVVRERRPALVGYAYLVCGSRSEAEEITQEAIVRTFARGRAKTSVAQAEGYIRRAIVNEAIDRSRRRKVAQSRRTLVAVPDAVPGHAGTVASDAYVEYLLGTLTPQERAVVVLKYIDDRTVTQIGAALKLADGTVKRYLYNAAQKLRGLVEETAEDHADTEYVLASVIEGRYA